MPRKGDGIARPVNNDDACGVAAATAAKAERARRKELSEGMPLALVEQLAAAVRELKAVVGVADEQLSPLHVGHLHASYGVVRGSELEREQPQPDFISHLSHLSLKLCKLCFIPFR